MGDDPSPRPGYFAGVVAPIGFDPPGLARAVERSLHGLLIRRHRTHAVRLTVIVGEPVGAAVTEVAGKYGWMCSGRGSPRWPARLALSRVATELASVCDGLVIFHGGALPPELVKVRSLCPWLGTEVRSVRVGDESEPQSEKK
jgi:hypothetical protein